jgi:hypothetical protein
VSSQLAELHEQAVVQTFIFSKLQRVTCIPRGVAENSTKILLGNCQSDRSSHNTITKCMLQSQLLLNQDASLSGERRNDVQKNCLKPFVKPSELSKRRLQYLGGEVKENPNKSSTKTTATATPEKKLKKKKKLPKKSWKQTTKQTLYLQHAETTRTTTTTVFRKARRRKCNDGPRRKCTK